ncbi:hypothetical protein LXA43DRAFT_130770 [Ganoderma leucocontextum]|nr:hypothetical protein LXA43DRAFT_130770 [Ganoderma leucocontextum]
MPGPILSLSTLGKERAWRWKARYRPTRILRVIIAAIWPTHKLSGSISLLPPELLHAIFELLAFSDHNTLSSCMRVCTRWHNIARLHFFAVVPVSSHHCGPLSQLLCTDPGLALYVKHVRFIRARGSADAWCKTCYHGQVSWAPFDVQSLASTLPALGLTNLRYLSLVGYDNILHPPVLCQRPVQWQRPPVRVSLQQLSFDSYFSVTRVLPGLLSLFSVHTLVIRVHSYLAQPSRQLPPIHPSIPLASFAIQDLVLDMAHNLEESYQFFQSILIPGNLRALGIEVWTAQDSTRLGQFLRSSAAQDLRSINIDISLLLLFGPPEETTHGVYADVGTVFSALGAALSHCTRLQSFRIRFTNHVNHRWGDPVCHRETFESIIANLPPTLRAFAIHIGVHNWRSWKHFCDGAVGLDVVDRLLSAPSGAGGRFPHLQRVELQILEEVGLYASNKPINLKEPRPTLLPRLNAAGLLQVSDVVHKVQPYGRRVDVYLPPEIQ